MNDTEYFTGSTVHLSCTFESDDGARVNPDSVFITFYNARYEEIQSVHLNESNAIETGVYTYDYILPDKEMPMIYEWNGFYQGSHSFQRKAMNVKFV